MGVPSVHLEGLSMHALAITKKLGNRILYRQSTYDAHNDGLGQGKASAEKEIVCKKVCKKKV